LFLATKLLPCLSLRPFSINSQKELVSSISHCQDFEASVVATKMKQTLFGIVCLVAVASAVLLKSDPFVRLIPADVLRGTIKHFLL